MYTDKHPLHKENKTGQLFSFLTVIQSFFLNLRYAILSVGNNCNKTMCIFLSGQHTCTERSGGFSCGKSSGIVKAVHSKV